MSLRQPIRLQDKLDCSFGGGKSIINSFGLSCNVLSYGS